MGRFRTLNIPVELVAVLIDSVNDRRENLSDILDTGVYAGLEAQDEMETDLAELDKLLEFLGE